MRKVNLTNTSKYIQTLGMYVWQNIESYTDENDKKNELYKAVYNKINAIDKILEQNNLHCDDLADNSRKFYYTLKLLSDKKYFEKYIEAVRAAKFILSFAETNKNMIVIFNYTDAIWRAKVTKKDFYVTLSLGFIEADKNIIYLLLEKILDRDKSKDDRIYKFVLSDPYKKIIKMINISDKAKNSGRAVGDFYDLNAIFDKVNDKYFEGGFHKPHLEWSGNKTFRKFGEYKSGKDKVVISKSLDSSKIPSFIVEFVLYHELLHKIYAAKFNDGKYQVHHKEFRLAEQMFENYIEAETELQKIAKNLRHELD